MANKSRVKRVFKDKDLRPRKKKPRHKWNQLYFQPVESLNVIKDGEKRRTGFHMYRELTCKKCKAVFRKTLGLQIHTYEIHGLDLEEEKQKSTGKRANKQFWKDAEDSTTDEIYSEDDEFNEEWEEENLPSPNGGPSGKRKGRPKSDPSPMPEVQAYGAGEWEWMTKHYLFQPKVDLFGSLNVAYRNAKLNAKYEIEEDSDLGESEEEITTLIIPEEIEDIIANDSEYSVGVFLTKERYIDELVWKQLKDSSNDNIDENDKDEGTGASESDKTDNPTASTSRTKNKNSKLSLRKNKHRKTNNAHNNRNSTNNDNIKDESNITNEDKGISWESFLNRLNKHTKPTFTYLKNINKHDELTDGNEKSKHDKIADNNKELVNKNTAMQTVSKSRNKHSYIRSEPKINKQTATMENKLETKPAKSSGDNRNNKSNKNIALSASTKTRNKCGKNDIDRRNDNIQQNNGKSTASKTKNSFEKYMDNNTWSTKVVESTAPNKRNKHPKLFNETQREKCVKNGNGNSGEKTSKDSENLHIITTRNKLTNIKIRKGDDTNSFEKSSNMCKESTIVNSSFRDNKNINRKKHNEYTDNNTRNNHNKNTIDYDRDVVERNTATSAINNLDKTPYINNKDNTTAHTLKRKSIDTTKKNDDEFKASSAINKLSKRKHKFTPKSLREPTWESFLKKPPKEDSSQKKQFIDVDISSSSSMSSSSSDESSDEISTVSKRENPSIPGTSTSTNSTTSQTVSRSKVRNKMNQSHKNRNSFMKIVYIQS